MDKKSTDISKYVQEGLSLKSQAEYQEGSVVSKTLISKSAGTITLFAFDKDQGLSEHTAPFDAMILIMDGSAEITISKKVYTVSEGEFIFLPQGEPHALKAVSRFKMMLVMIKA